MFLDDPGTGRLAADGQRAVVNDLVTDLFTKMSQGKASW